MGERPTDRRTGRDRTTAGTNECTNERKHEQTKSRLNKNTKERKDDRTISRMNENTNETKTRPNENMIERNHEWTNHERTNSRMNENTNGRKDDRTKSRTHAIRNERKHERTKRRSEENTKRTKRRTTEKTHEQKYDRIENTNESKTRTPRTILVKNAASCMYQDDKKKSDTRERGGEKPRLHCSPSAWKTSDQCAFRKA